MPEINSLWDRIKACAEASPDRLALIEPGRCAASYAQLSAMLATVTNVLDEIGVGADHSVAVILPDGVCGLASVLGVASVCACAPINPAATAAELEADLLELRASAVITSAELKVPQAVAARLGLSVIEAFPLEETCGWRISRHSTQPPAPLIHQQISRPAILLHTSATTGRRKLVPLSTTNLHAMFENTAHAMKLGPDDRLLMLARLFHTQGILSPCAQLLAGGSVIVARGFTPQSLGSLLETQRPTWYTCGPTLHRAILTYLAENPLSKKTSLRFVRSGGTRLPADLRLSLERALHVPVLNVYGLSETGAVVCTSLDSQQPDESGDGIGKSMGPDIAVMSADGAMLPVGTDGEIVVSGPTVMAGYLNDPAANRDAFFGKWFRTGDLGRLDKNGILHITGRLKEIINRGGQKIVPEDVEAVLSSHEAVLEAAAFGMPHATLGEDVACAVVLRKDFLAGEKELREYAAQQLASFKVPRRIYQVDTLPYSATGKPLRVALKERFSGDRQSQTAVEPTPPSVIDCVPQLRATPGGPPNDIVCNLHNLWRKHTNSKHIRQDLDFFSSGGDSLSAVAMLVEVEEAAGLKSPLYSARFLQEPTFSTLIAMVADAIAGHTDVSSNAIRVLPLRKGDERLPIYMIPSDGDEGYGFRQLSRLLGDHCPFALVRPENCWYERSISSLEETGAQAADAILAVKPPGPCVVGGYCYGGVVAYETVRQLERRGETVFLVLFDVPTPGHPHILDWRIYLRGGTAEVKMAWRSRRPAPAVHFIGRVVRRLAWFAIRRICPGRTAHWRSAPLRWLRSQARHKYFSFYRPGPVRAPLLHFLAEYERDVVTAKSRWGWQSKAFSGTTVHWLPCDHNNLLNQAHLKQVAGAIQSWPALHFVREPVLETT